MTTNNALIVSDDFDTLQRMSMALYKSGYFQNVKNEAQAIVKVMAGAELGLPPFASMAGIHIVQGKPVLGSNIIATLVKNDHRYDYRIGVADDAECVLLWYEHGKQVGKSEFTIEEAKRAGLTSKDNWKKYPSDMLFARAISRGARRFAPGIFGGAPVYTPDELNVDEDPDGNVVEGEVVNTVNRLKETPVDEDVKAALDEANEILIGKRDAERAPEPDWVDGDDDEEPEVHTTSLEDEPQDAKVPDAVAARNWLASKIMNGHVQLGIVGDSVSSIEPFYNDWMHVKNALTQEDDGFDFPEAFRVIRTQKVTELGAKKIQDWLIARKVG